MSLEESKEHNNMGEEITTKEEEETAPLPRSRWAEAEEVAKRLFVREALILAPMVRASTLPLRLTSLDMGADVVFTDEIVDKRILRCERRFNRFMNTVSLSVTLILVHFFFFWRTLFWWTDART